MTKLTYFKHPTAIVEKGADIGAACRIWHHAHVRTFAHLGLAVSIGKNVFVDSYVSVGAGSRIQNNCSLYNGLYVEDKVFIGPHVTFTNDKHPRVSDDWQIVPTYVQKGASIGAHATIVCGITIGEYAMIGSGAVVTDDVPPYGIVRGNPGRLVGYACRQGHPMERAIKDGAYRCRECGATLQVSHVYKEATK